MAPQHSTGKRSNKKKKKQPKQSQFVPQAAAAATTPSTGPSPKPPKSCHHHHNNTHNDNAATNPNDPSNAKPVFSVQEPSGDALPYGNDADSGKAAAAAGARGGGLYQQYKAATERFKAALSSLVQDQKLEWVHDLVRATQRLVQQGQAVVPPALLADLRIALHVRVNVAKAYGAHADDGHEYFIQVLNYCLVQLRQFVQRDKNETEDDEEENHNQEDGGETTRRKKRSTPRSSGLSKQQDAFLQPHPQQDAQPNRFNPLWEDDDDDEEEEDKDAAGNKDDSEQDKDAAAVTPPPPPPSKEFSLTQDLIQGSDWFHACTFLISLDTLMQTISFHYRSLKRYCDLSEKSEEEEEEEYNYDKAPPSAEMVRRLMQMSMNVNAAIHQVLYLEQDLASEFPHLDTFYRVVACVYLRQVAWQDVQARLGTEIPSSCTLPVLTEFLGDILECACRNPSDPRNGFPKMVSKFAKRHGLEGSVMEEFGRSVFHSCLLEVQTDREEEQNAKLYPVQNLQKPHTWMAPLAFIGGDRSLLNTHKLLQGLSNVVKPGSILCLKDGFFGTTWKEDGDDDDDDDYDDNEESSGDDKKENGKSPRLLRRRRPRIRGDLDQLLMGHILPELIATTWGGLVEAITVPRLYELLPLFGMLKSHLAHVEAPVPVSLSFGVHALLTGIFELQGQGHVGRIARMSQEVYSHFFRQLWKQLDSPLPCHMIWKPNLKSMLLFESMPKTIVPPQHEAFSRAKERIAFWNPTCAGMFLLYATYFISCEVGGGCMIDSFAQLRIVLHLYNALKECKYIPLFGVPILTTLDQMFGAQVRAVWPRTCKSTKGQFVKDFWIAYGMKPEYAQECSDMVRAAIQSQTDGSLVVTNSSRMNNRRGDVTRKMDYVDPKSFSKSYRRICRREFFDMVDRYHPEEVQKTEREKSNKGGSHQGGPPLDLYQHFVRVNDTMDAMDDDERLLEMNLHAVGGILNQFVYSLLQELNWKESIEEYVATAPESLKASNRADGTRVKKGSFLASDANFERYVIVTQFQYLLGALDMEGESSEGDDPKTTATTTKKKKKKKTATTTCEDVQRAANHMINFFCRIQRDEYRFYNF